MPDHLQTLLAQRDLPIKDVEAFLALRDAFPSDPIIPPDVDDEGHIISEGKVPRPAIFKKDPPIVGNKTANAFRMITRRFPQLTDAASSIIEGPTAGSMESMMESDFPPERFAGTNLGGVTDQRNKQIGINPDDGGDPITLFHELGHAKGYNEIGSQVLEELLRRMTGGKSITSGSQLAKKLPTAPLDVLQAMLHLSKREEQ